MAPMRGRMAEELTFDWVPFYEELADKLAAYRTRQKDLVSFLEELRAQGCKVTPLEDKDAEGHRFLLTEMDPFTFFGTFNRAITNEARIQILHAVKTRFSVSASLPSGFTGIPVLSPLKSWFFSLQAITKTLAISKTIR